MSKLQLVLFDCDGTLIDSAAFIHDCMVKTFEDYTIVPPSYEATCSIIGLSLDQAIARLLDCEVDGHIQEIVRRYKDNFQLIRAHSDYQEKMYPGIMPMLQRLKTIEHILLGMVTGKSQRGVRTVCERYGLDCFMTVRTADDCPSKPHPAMVLECCAETGIMPDHSFVIGDSIYDMEMAAAAGAIPVAVSWGYHSVDALKQAGARYILQKPADIFDILGLEETYA